MRGADQQQGSMLCLLSPEQRVPQHHPLRGIRRVADDAVKGLDPILDDMYSSTGRPSIPPERLLKSFVLMALYSVRSERLFCEQLDYNLLFRWFLDMDMVEDSFDHSTFSKNRQRLLDHGVAQHFFSQVVGHARGEGLLSDDHFTVDGTLIDAWASLKSFRPKDEPPPDQDTLDDPGNPTVDFRGEKRSNRTHRSATDPESRLMRKGKGKEAKLSYCLNALMENRNGLLVDFRVAQATGTAERQTALAMLEQSLPGSKRITLGADKGYDTWKFVTLCRILKVTPHVARNTGRKGGSSIDARTTRHEGYGISQRIRKRVEEIFGWTKTVGNFSKTRYLGQAKTQMAAYFVGAAYNLLRIAKLTEAPG
ncbi:MAG: IS5 family transposase [Proteobacteria bacterium]|nr:IS5 family transposase [Pseudomonadota bacterium]